MEDNGNKHWQSKGSEMIVSVISYGLIKSERYKSKEESEGWW